MLTLDQTIIEPIAAQAAQNIPKGPASSVWSAMHLLNIQGIVASKSTTLRPGSCLVHREREREKERKRHETKVDLAAICRLHDVILPSCGLSSRHRGVIWRSSLTTDT